MTRILRLRIAATSLVFALLTTATLPARAVGFYVADWIYSTWPTVTDSQIVNVNTAGATSTVANSANNVFRPADVAVDAHGYVYITNSNRTIRKYAPDGTEVYRNPVTHSAWYSLGTAPIGIAFDPSGSLFIAGNNNRVYKLDLDSNGNPSGVTAIPNVVNASYLAMGKDGSMYVSRTNYDEVDKLVYDAVNDSWSTTLFATANSVISGIAFDRYGNLYGAMDNNIDVFDPSGNFMGTVVDNLASPTDVAFGMDGNMYVTVENYDPNHDTFQGQLLQYSPTGTLLKTIDLSPGSRPMALAAVGVYLGNGPQVLAPSVPEPSALMWLAAIPAAWGVRRRRQGRGEP